MVCIFKRLGFGVELHRQLFEDDIADLLESEIESQLGTQVPEVPESTLQNIALSTDFDLMGTTIVGYPAVFYLCRQPELALEWKPT